MEQKQHKIEVLFEGLNELGEGAVWNQFDQKLYWVDIYKKFIHRYDPVTKKREDFQFDDGPTSLAVCRSGKLIVSFAHKGFAFVEIDNKQSIQYFNNPLKDPEIERFNDGKCDRFGRFYAGTMAKNYYDKIGTLYRVDRNLEVSKVLDNISITNALNWNKDNTKFYFSDSITQEISQYDFDQEKGLIKNQKVLNKLTEGFPDGATIDKQGYIWWAIFRGSKIIRFTPDGQVEREIQVPVEKPTTCMFGGKDLKTLYVTSCGKEPTDEFQLEKPNGGLIAITFDESEDIQGIEQSIFLD